MVSMREYLGHRLQGGILLRRGGGGQHARGGAGPAAGLLHVSLYVVDGHLLVGPDWL